MLTGCSVPFSALPTEQVATDYIPSSTSTSHPSASQVRTQIILFLELP